MILSPKFTEWDRAGAYYHQNESLKPEFPHFFLDDSGNGYSVLFEVVKQYSLDPVLDGFDAVDNGLFPVLVVNEEMVHFEDIEFFVTEVAFLLGAEEFVAYETEVERIPSCLEINDRVDDGRIAFLLHSLFFSIKLGRADAGCKRQSREFIV